MNEIDNKNENESTMTTAIDHKRYHRSTTKSIEDNNTSPEHKNSISNRMKRKTSLINSETLHRITKKLDSVKSTEFQTKDHRNSNIDSNATVEQSTSNFNNNSNNNNHIEHENDLDDYADRIFNYLDEADPKQVSSTSSQNEFDQKNQSTQPIVSLNIADHDIQPYLCSFCPYFTQNFHEFQTHISKHTEKNFRCLLCNCMYKYRRDCVTHMKRKHANMVTGSISQYIQKMNNNNNNNNNSTQSCSSIPIINSIPMNSSTEPKRYGCPYCSLMTKSTSSIYKHQSRKHATFPKVVHKYSTDDPNSRALIAILKQKSIKNEQITKSQYSDLVSNVNDGHDSLGVSSSLLSLTHHHHHHHHIESLPTVNRHRCAASKHITAHNVHLSNGRLSKVFRCCLCGYRAHHRSNVVRHVKKIHTIDFNESNLSTTILHNEAPPQSIGNSKSEQSKPINESSTKLMIDQDDNDDDEDNNDDNDDDNDNGGNDDDDDEEEEEEEDAKPDLNESQSENLANYSFNTTVQAPLIMNKTHNPDSSTNPYADIHLSINIFLPKKKKPNSLHRAISDDSNNEENSNDRNSDDEDVTDDDLTNIHITSNQQQNFSNGSLYKPHKCRRCFYRSNWRTDMLHHIRLKHHINQATKSDYISMDFDTAVRSFSNYEKTFGKVLKNRLLLPKIEYTDCTWEELKSKLFIIDDDKKTNRHDFLSSSSIEQTTIINNSFSLMNNTDKKSID